MLADQRRWRNEVRNQCADTACLLKQCPLHSRASLESAQCPVKEEVLLASWQRIKGRFCEEFALERSGGSRSFTSWLHQRPEMTGSWTLRHCTLDIFNLYNSALSLSFHITGLRNAVLLLRDDGSGAISSYRKQRPSALQLQTPPPSSSAILRARKIGARSTAPAIRTWLNRARLLQPGFRFPALQMRDKKDNATLDLPGFGQASALPHPPAEARRTTVPRRRKVAIKQQQLALLEPTDASGLPVWRRDENTDITGLPIWAAA